MKYILTALIAAFTFSACSTTCSSGSTCSTDKAKAGTSCCAKKSDKCCAKH